MAKKRSCRRTVDENKIHEKAVKMRKMTDEQLVHYVEDRAEKARSEGYNCGMAAGARKQAPRPGVKEFLEDIKNKGIKGVGAATIGKLERMAVENGYT